MAINKIFSAVLVVLSLVSVSINAQGLKHITVDLNLNDYKYDIVQPEQEKDFFARVYENATYTPVDKPAVSTDTDTLIFLGLSKISYAAVRMIRINAEVDLIIREIQKEKATETNKEYKFSSWKSRWAFNKEMKKASPERIAELQMRLDLINGTEEEVSKATYNDIVYHLDHKS